MKNLQKGFIVPVLLVIIALLVVGGGVYIYENKKAEVPAVVDTGTQPANQNQQQTNTQTPQVTTQQNPANNKPVTGTPATNTNKPIITSISQSSGPIGTVVELKGYNLLNNRGDQNLIIENSKGEVASFGFGNPEHLKLSEKYVSMKFTLNEKVCKQWGTDMGGPCTKGWMTIVPGDYKIYVASNGFTDTSAMSNKVAFAVTVSPNKTPSITILTPNGGEMWQEGKMYQITWSAKNITGNQSIKLVDRNNSVIRVIESNVNSTNNGSDFYSYNWTIPREFVSEASPLKFKILVSSSEDMVSDYSDNQFTIFAGAY